MQVSGDKQSEFRPVGQRDSAHPDFSNDCHKYRARCIQKNVALTVANDTNSERGSGSQAERKRLKQRIVEIEDVKESFNGCRRKNMVPLSEGYPEVASEWLYKLNCGWGPEDFSGGSNVKVWWRCPDCTRKYKAKILNRAKSNTGCPYCASKLVCEDNSLADVHPAIATEWDVRRNGNLSPKDVCYSSMKEVWWKCYEGPDHRWKCAINARTRAVGGGCPFCAGLRVSVTNSLASICPQVAAEWHKTKNKKLTPASVVAYSNKVVWWKCTYGHSWRASINDRVRRLSGCQVCRFGK